MTDAGLKLKPSKCYFFHSTLAYLGHIVSADGIETDPKKIPAIKNWPTPATLTKVHSFLGFTSHYSCFIYKFAYITDLLNLLAAGENASKKRQKVEWTDECEESYRKHKELCSRNPILAYAVYSKPLKLHADACGIRLVAVLYQKQDDGTDRVIAYARTILHKAEMNYPAHKLEFLVLKWAITDGFHEYLYGGTFDVHTDNNPLTYILTSAKLDTVGQHWLPAWQTTTSNSTIKLECLMWRLKLCPIFLGIEKSVKLDNHTVKAIMAECCKVAIFEPYIGYLSISHKMQLVSSAPGISIVN